MNIREKIGYRIKEIRNIQNLTQEAVAFKAEIDRTFMNHVEKGRRNISIESLQKIVNALDFSFKDFFASELFNSGNTIKEKK